MYSEGRSNCPWKKQTWPLSHQVPLTTETSNKTEDSTFVLPVDVRANKGPIKGPQQLSTDGINVRSGDGEKTRVQLAPDYDSPPGTSNQTGTNRVQLDSSKDTYVYKKSSLHKTKL